MSGRLFWGGGGAAEGKERQMSSYVPFVSSDLPQHPQSCLSLETSDTEQKAVRFFSMRLASCVDEHGINFCCDLSMLQ